MATELAGKFRAELGVLQAVLQGLPPELADTPWRVGGWTRKQIVGHLLDSAANNRQRFVRATADGRYAGPKYAQDAWVAAHGYSEQRWETLLRWWQQSMRFWWLWSIAFPKIGLGPCARWAKMSRLRSDS